MPRRNSRPLTPRGPSGKSGTFLYHMYKDPSTAVTIMRTKMICSAWNLTEKLVDRSLAAMLIFKALVSIKLSVPSELPGTTHDRGKELAHENKEQADVPLVEVFQSLIWSTGWLRAAAA